MVSGCSALTTVNLPSTLKSLTAPATFANATALESIDLPEGLTITEGSTFNGCKSLKSIELPKSITRINSSMFSDCSSLETVTPKGTITAIEEYAFYGCSSLKEAAFTSTVTTMGESVFKKCATLKSIDLSGLTAISDNVCYGSSNISSVKLNDDLTAIGKGAFCYTSIDSITLPGKVNEIGRFAFFGCGLAGELVIPDNVKWLAGIAFKNNSIGTLKVGNGIKTIVAGTFENNKSLKTVYIGSNVDSIDAAAFKGCDALETVTIDLSSDNITISDDAIPSTAKVIFLEKSIGDVGDTIDPESKKTLQEAIDTSKPGEVITLKKDVKISKPLIVPEGKDVTIRSDNKYVLTSEKDKCDKLITVEEGAKLTLAGDLTLNMVRLNLTDHNGAVTVHGILALKDSANITRTSINNSAEAAVMVCGSRAVMNMSGGKIDKCSNTKKGQNDGTVRVCDGGTLNMAGGSIENNVASSSESWNSTPGVLLFSDSTFHMTGGTIKDNIGYRGSAVMLLGKRSTSLADFTMDGGTITENKSICGFTVPYGEKMPLPASGAVHVEDYARFTMNGGIISRNTASGYSKNAGGGVCVMDSTLNNSFSTDFTMNGGTIADNAASDMGGGLWFCPTGDAKIYVKDGSGIFNNSASGAGDDFAAVPRTDEKYTITLADRLLGGGKANWYNDGKITGGTNSPLGIVDDSVARYNDSNPGNAETGITDKTHGYALKAISTEGAKAQAETMGKLVIEDNSAVRGGGVGANGGVTIGEKDTTTTKTISVVKKWVGNGTKPVSITVDLIANGNVIETLKLTEATDWMGTFEHLPKDNAYTVREEAVEGWTSLVKIEDTADGNATATITNTHTYTPPTIQKGNINVTKVVHADGKESTKLNGTFYITLFSDSACTKIADNTKTQSLTIADGKSHTVTFSDLAPGTYYAAETNEDGSQVYSKAAKIVGFDSGAITNNKAAIELTGGETENLTITNEYTTITNSDTDNPSNNDTNGNEPSTPGHGSGSNTPSNNNSSSPNTGDASNLGLWIALGTTSVLLGGVLIELRRRESRD